MDAYHRAVAAKIAALHQAGEHQRASELEALAAKIDRLLGGL